MPSKMISCVSLPPATLSSVPIYDFALANEEAASRAMKEWYPCCGKSICNGCVHSLCESGNGGTCPFCKADTLSGTDEEEVEKLMKRVEANDAGTMFILGHYYYQGQLGLQQDLAKALELWTQAAELGSRDAHFQLGMQYNEGGNSKKAKFHYEAAAMAGHEAARCNLGSIEGNSGNIERAIKHCTIAASAGHYIAMQNLIEEGAVSRESIDSTLIAYNSCAKMRSEARDAYLRRFY
jgi:TPR repeat protein